MKVLSVPLAFACLLAAGMAQAVVVEVSRANNSADALFGSLTFDGVAQDRTRITGTTLIENDVADSGTLAYTISGLDLGGDGLTNDGVVVSFAVSANNNLRTAGWLAPSGGNMINEPGDFVALEFKSLVVLIDGVEDAAATDASSFLGFNRVTLQGLTAGETYLINGVEGRSANNDFNYADHVKVSFGSGDFRPCFWNFAFEVKYEPVTTLGLILAGAGEHFCHGVCL